MHIYQLHNLIKQPTIPITKRLHHNPKFPSVLVERKTRLKDEIPNSANMLTRKIETTTPVNKSSWD